MQMLKPAMEPHADRPDGTSLCLPFEAVDAIRFERILGKRRQMRTCRKE